MALKQLARKAVWLCSVDLAHRDIDLDVVRGIAILLAITWHIGHPTGVAVIDWPLAPLRRVGWAGVDLFFVLSGFLIGRLMLTEQRRYGNLKAGRFLARRAVRLWPALYAYLLAQLAFGDKPWRSYLPQNLIHIQNFAGTSLSHLWSLAVEEHFYLGAALLFVVAPQLVDRPKRLLSLLLGLMAAALALRCGAVVAGVAHETIQWQTEFRVDALAMGVVLATLSVDFPAVLDAISRRKAWLAVTAVSLGVVIGAFPAHGSFIASVGYSISAVWGASIVLLLYKSDFGTKQRWLARPLAFMGLYSYSMYLWHLAGAKVGLAALLRIAPGVGQPVQLLFRYGGAIVVAFVMTTLVEHPSIRIRDALLPRRKAPRPSPEPPVKAPEMPVSPSNPEYTVAPS